MTKIREFQDEVRSWTVRCFGAKIARDPIERNYRFIEEAIELVQALGCSKEDVLRLVEHVYSRPVGEATQEVGGCLVTLAALCNVHNINMMLEGYEEVDRINEPEALLKIRGKQAEKSVRSGPLP